MPRLLLLAAAIVLLAACSTSEPAANPDADDDGGDATAEVSAEATTAGDVTWTFDIAVTDQRSARVRASHDAAESCDVGFTVTLLDDAGNVLAAGEGMAGGVGEGDTATETVQLDEPVDAGAVAAAEADTDLNACASDAG